MSVWRDMAHDAGYRGEEADQYAQAIEADAYRHCMEEVEEARQADDPCPTCGGTGQITRPHSDDHARFPHRPITYRCPDCTDRKPT